MRQVQEPLPTIADSWEESPEKMQRNEGYEKIAQVEEGKLISERILRLNSPHKTSF